MSFYLHATSRVHKSNPASHGKAFCTRPWRKKSQGFKSACCAKGKNEGSPGIVPKFMAAVSHSKGIIKCYHYEGGTTGEKIVNLIEGQFPNLFVEEHFWKKCLLFFQDSDPSQNCKKSREAMEEVGVAYLKYQHVP